LVVAVDTLFLSGRYRHTGTGVYLSRLLPACLRMSEDSELGIRFQGFAPRGERWNGNGFTSPLFTVRESWAASNRRAWLLGGMALNTSLARPDVVFMPTAHASVPGPLAPVVTTILDVMHCRLPAWMLETGKSVRWLTWANAKLARRIITISSCSKGDLVDIYNLDPDRVEVTYLGYDKRLYNAAPPGQKAGEQLLDRLGIRSPYVFHHGMVQLRKNLIRLIQAWDQVTEGPGGLETQLVLAGPPGLGYEQIQESAAKSPGRDRIVFTGALESSELALLIKNASVCVIPSLYEGFCLPLVEAMACGVPTIASNSSCIPEISGGVLEYFDPLSVEEMTAVMRRALEDSELRERLRRDGLARAAEFSWERCARETLEIFRRTAVDCGRKYANKFRQ
jgi:glycosyltransferase involved in cell wall biosynthesis